MTEIERHILFDIWITRNFHHIGINVEDFTCSHYKFGNKEHFAIVFLHSDKVLRVFEEKGGLQIMKRSSISTGVRATLGKTQKVIIPDGILDRIPFPIKPLESIDIIQGSFDFMNRFMLSDPKNLEGILDSIIEFD